VYLKIAARILGSEGDFCWQMVAYEKTFTRKSKTCLIL